MFAAGAEAAAPRIFAITDVRIVTAPGRVIDQGTVVLRDGLIEAVGADVGAPADAWLIEAETEWTVYPAFIDAASAVGLDSGEAQGGNGRRRGGADEGRPGAPHELESVRAQQAVLEQIDFTHGSIERHRELGFAAAHVLPRSGVFRGESAVILLRDAPAHELVLVPRQGQVVALEKSSFMAGQYPSSSIGAVAAVRQTLLDARRQMIWNERYAADPVGLPHPEYRASDPALLAVLRGERPVIFVAGARLDPGRFAALAAEFDLTAVTVAQDLAQPPRELEAGRMPILLPLEVPDPPDAGDPDALQEATLEELQAAVRAPQLPARLAAIGTDFAFVTAGMKSVREFHENLAAVVEAGLDEEQALAALTTVPARLLGMERSLGSIAPGSQANLLVVEGDLFTAKPKLRHLFVAGYHEEFEPEPTVGDPDADVDPRGRWEIVTEVMGRSSESTWTISGEADDYEGYSETADGGRRAFRSVELQGNALTVVSSTPRGEVAMTVVVDADSLAGDTTMESSRGAVKMSVEGRRVAGPEERQ